MWWCLETNMIISTAIANSAELNLGMGGKDLVETQLNHFVFLCLSESYDPVLISSKNLRKLMAAFNYKSCQ